jgi:hypothetical protein
MRPNAKQIGGRALAIMSVACALFAAPNPTRAADPAYCDQYAKLAIHETEVNMATPGCFKGFDNRWHLDYQRHYEWCLTASYAAVNAERDYRRMRGAQCQGH